MNYLDIFTPEEWNHLKDVMNSIHHRIPENQMHLIWNSYQRIAKVNSPQPCACQSSAKYWIEAVNVIRNFITNQEIQ